MHASTVIVLWVVVQLTWGYRNHGATGPDPSTKDPITITSLGSIRGSWMTSRRGRRFESYRGIRYAQPPVGELRFQPPKPITRYDKEVDATQEGPACPQPKPAEYYLDEDCLRLNVYKPYDTTKPLPVLVYLHQGGFYAGSGRSDVVGPHYFMDRDMVLVTINYRLASLGFLSTGDELAPGNNGFKDQVAALRWVRDNIAAFGGDPQCVTLMGYSAGSRSVAVHLLSPMSKGLFQRAISMSASPFSQVVIGHEQFHLAKKQAQPVGCPTNSSQVIMDCLKTVHWRTLGRSLSGFAEFGIDPVQIWIPVVENDFGQERFLPQHPLELLKDGKLQSIPYIISQTRDEFAWLANNILNNATRLELMDKDWNRIAPISFILPRDDNRPARILREKYIGHGSLKKDAKTAVGLGKLYGDSLIGFAMHRLANLMCRHSKAPVYYYEFDYMGQNSFYKDPVTKKPTGIVHHDDLIYMFPIRTRFPDIGLNDADAKMVDKMTAFVYNFARHGDPNPRGDLPELEGLSWPPMLPDERNYLQLGSSFSVHQNLFEDRFKVWDELFPIDYTLGKSKS